MATEEASPVSTGYESLAQWTGWIAAVSALWVAISPFVLSGEVASGTPMWSTIGSGLVLLVLGAFTAYSIRSSVTISDFRYGEWSSWLGAVAGLWFVIVPFVFDSAIDSGTVMWNHLIVGLLAFLLTAYAGYFVYTHE